VEKGTKPENGDPGGLKTGWNVVRGKRKWILEGGATGGLLHYSLYLTFRKYPDKGEVNETAREGVGGRDPDTKHRMWHKYQAKKGKGKITNHHISNNKKGGIKARDNSRKRVKKPLRCKDRDYYQQISTTTQGIRKGKAGC